MKNKTIRIFFLGLFFLMFFLKNSYSEVFEFLGSELNLLNIPKPSKLRLLLIMGIYLLEVMGLK